MKNSVASIESGLIFVHSDRVAFRQVDGEVLIVPIRMSTSDPTGVYRLNHTASFVWAQLDGRKDVNAIVAKMVSQFDVTADEAFKDVSELLQDLLSFDAIVELDAIS